MLFRCVLAEWATPSRPAVPTGWKPGTSYVKTGLAPLCRLVVRKRVPWLPEINYPNGSGAGMVRNARVTCQNNCRLIASATEWAVFGSRMSCRSPFGSLL